MYQLELCRQIVQTVDNARAIDNADDEQVARELCGLLRSLQPVDRERFAKWGFPKQQSTPEECWPVPDKPDDPKLVRSVMDHNREFEKSFVAGVERLAESCERRRDKKK